MKRILIISFLFFTLFAVDAIAGKRYWISGVTSNWNNTANWSVTSGGTGGASVPGSSDTAYYDANGTGQCDVDAAVNIKRLEMSAGTFNQGSFAVTIGTSGAVLSGGTFTGGSGTITLTGVLANTGCAFTSTSGMLTTNSNFTRSGTGAFTHNNGKVRFTATCTITGDHTLYQLEFAATSTATFTVTSGNVLTVNNTTTISGSQTQSINTGTVECKGNLVITSTATGGGGNGTFSFTGNSNQTLDGAAAASVGRLPNVVINKSGGTLFFQDNITVFGNYTRTAGDTDPQTSLVHFSGTKSISGVDTLYDVSIGAGTYTINDTIKALRNLAVNGVSSSIINTGTIYVAGDINVNNSATGGGGTATIVINGSGLQVLTGSGVATIGKLPNITIDKSSTLTLMSIISVAGNWVYTRGTVIPGTSTVMLYDNFNLDGTGTTSTMSFNRLQVAGGTRTITGNVDVNENFLLSSSATCIAGSYTLYVGGNWNTQGTWTANTSTVVFDGTDHNWIRGATSTTVAFANLIINRNASLKSVTLLNPVKINTSMTLQKGRVKTTSTNILEFVDNATCTVTNNDSAYVHGPVRKIGNDAFSFPLGDTTLSDAYAYHPLAITAPGSVTDQFTATYYATAQSYGTAKASTLNTISTTQYWLLDRVAGTSTPTVTVSWNGNGDNTAFSEMRVAEWTGAQWTDRGQGGTGITSPTGTITASAALSFGVDPAPITISYAVVDKAYAVLQKAQPASGYHSTDGYVLYFGFEEEYNDQDNDLTFRVVRLSTDRPVVLSSSPANNPSIAYGNNRYKIDLYDSSNTPLTAGYYMLEVTNEKNEVWYLRFKI